MRNRDSISDGLSNRTCCSGPVSASTSSAVTGSKATSCTTTSSMPIAARVAITLRVMYGASRDFWLGLTTSDWTADG